MGGSTGEENRWQAAVPVGWAGLGRRGKQHCAALVLEGLNKVREVESRGKEMSRAVKGTPI